MEQLTWSQTQHPGEVEIVLRLNAGTTKEAIDCLFNARRLRVFVGEDLILDEPLYNPIEVESCTWTYNQRSRKLEISLTKDSDHVVWCAAFLEQDAFDAGAFEDLEIDRGECEKYLPQD